MVLPALLRVMPDTSLWDEVLTGTGVYPRATTARDWLLLDGDRLAVASILLGVVLLAATALLDGTLTAADSALLGNLFASFIAGNLTLLTVVLSLNQLVLSRELRTPRELRSEVDAATEYVEEVERETSRHITPQNPSLMLHGLLGSVQARADVLKSDVDDLEGEGAEELRADVAELVASLDDRVEEMNDLLEEPGVGLFRALSTILRHDFASEIDEARRILDAHGEALPDPAASALDGIATRLEHLDIARQYIKTIYVQKELSYLSRVLLYVGFPSMLVAVGIILSVVAPGQSRLVTRGVVVASVTVSFAPLAVLFAYVLRMATVAERTAAVTPFPSP